MLVRLHCSSGILQELLLLEASESWVGFLKPKQPEGQRSATVQTAFLGSSVIPFLSDGRRSIALNLLDFVSNLGAV